jgi:hypothetical protein
MGRPRFFLSYALACGLRFAYCNLYAAHPRFLSCCAPLAVAPALHIATIMPTTFTYMYAFCPCVPWVSAFVLNYGATPVTQSGLPSDFDALTSRIEAYMKEELSCLVAEEGLILG